MQILTVTVAVDKTTYSYDKLYTYRIPPELAENAAVGMRVLVPFGRGNKKRVGLIMSLQEADTTEKGIKPILGLVDAKPLISEEGIAIIRFLKYHTFCCYFDAVNCLLPTGMAVHTQSRYVAAEGSETPSDLNEDYQKVYAYIRSKKDGVLAESLSEHFPDLNTDVILAVLESKKLISKAEELKRRIGDETVVMVRLTEDFLSDPQGYKPTKKQSAVVDFLADVTSASLKEIAYYTGVTRNVTDNLVKSGICEYFECETFRNPYEDVCTQTESEIHLTSGQEAVYHGLHDLTTNDSAEVALLHGVTGSGKTLVYLKLAMDMVQAGKSVIIMVPEISLTPQTVARFHAYFGDKVAVMHSGFTLAQRMDEWKRIKSGMAKVVVGTRSAVFAPLDDVGLIVIDEEQEHTYKSESSPRFSAHEVAKFRALQHRALLLLSSATPSVESYYYSKIGKYRLFELESRYAQAQLPDVYIVDMSTAPKAGTATQFSKKLLDEIGENLTRGEQSILLLNRRGYNTSLTCAKCNQTILCPNCSIAMTYHAANDMLMCHYCSYSEKVPAQCPNCGHEFLRHNGAGTQKIEEELQTCFPQASILRMDMDTTLKRMAHEEYFQKFSRHEYDIMIGTQMVSKGLDFENVTLAAVLNVDQSLYANDFRAFERTFSLITQVVGRSGRGSLRGRAVIQTYLPDNPVIQLASKQDYKAFFEEEIANRRAMVFPPFCDLCQISFNGCEQKEVIRAANLFTKQMTEILRTAYPNLPMKIIGPVPCTVEKMNNKFRYKIVLKCKNNKEFREFISRLLLKTLSEKEYQQVSVVADINPFNSI